MRMNLLEALSDNIVVDPDKCTTCGLCVDTCILDNLRLKLAPCRQACPLGVNCQGYVQLIQRGREKEALEMVERELPFPGILGRLCSAQCEDGCHRKATAGDAVAIKALKRYVSDLAANEGLRIPEKNKPTGKRCAVIGAGPAGMMAAFDLLARGHEVTVFDGETEPGGLLRWAIPSFRLPESILTEEWAKLDALGVEFVGGKRLGRDIRLDSLENDFDGIILAIGCGRPKRLEIPGENADGVVYALDLLREVRAGHSPQIGSRVVVIGGGDVALDSAQTALRLGAEKVRVVSLESREVLPASFEALAQAESEGVEVDGSWGPTQIQAINNRVSEVQLQRCLAVFDSLGRFAPSFDECTFDSVEADTVIIAIGQEIDPAWGSQSIDIDPLTLQFSDRKIFWAGDMVGGPSTIIEAMASGRRAAESVHRLFNGSHLKYGRKYQGPYQTDFEIDTSRGSDAIRVQPSWKKFRVVGDFEETEMVLSSEQALKEAERCYGCGVPFGKYRTCWFCLPCEVECPHDALWVEIPYLLR